MGGTAQSNKINSSTSNLGGGGSAIALVSPRNPEYDSNTTFLNKGQIEKEQN
jgi:hypothetical protein